MPPITTNVYLNFSIFTVFLKNRNIIFKMKRSKVTDYAALSLSDSEHTAFLVGQLCKPYTTEPTVALSELHSGHSSVSVKAVYDF